MLQFTTLPMHDEGGLLTLRQVLDKLPPNGLRWHVLDFEGVGTAPGGMTMQGFEHAVRASPGGYGVDWDGMLAFADGVEQTWNCLIAGIQPDAATMAERIRADDFAGCRYVVQAFDSTEWSIGTTDDVVGEPLATAVAG